ncbi:hypothetical protein [Sphingomonas limnosediminicola]
MSSSPNGYRVAERPQWVETCRSTSYISGSFLPAATLLNRRLHA